MKKYYLKDVNEQLVLKMLYNKNNIEIYYTKEDLESEYLEEKIKLLEGLKDNYDIYTLLNELKLIKKFGFKNVINFTNLNFKNNPMAEEIFNNLTFKVEYSNINGYYDGIEMISTRSILYSDEEIELKEFLKRKITKKNIYTNELIELDTSPQTEGYMTNVAVFNLNNKKFSLETYTTELKELNDNIKIKFVIAKELEPETISNFANAIIKSKTKNKVLKYFAKLYSINNNFCKSIIATKLKFQKKFYYNLVNYYRIYFSEIRKYAIDVIGKELEYLNIRKANELRKKMKEEIKTDWGYIYPEQNKIIIKNKKEFRKDLSFGLICYEDKPIERYKTFVIYK